MDRRCARTRRQGGRHSPKHRIAGRPRRAIRRRAAADPVGRHRPRRGLRGRQAGTRPFRPVGHRGEQRRLRRVRVHRRSIGAGSTGSVGNQCVWRVVGHPGRVALPARAAQRPHHPGVLDRRHHRVRQPGPLSRFQVGAGGVLPVAGSGGGTVRRARHVDRTGRLRHRLGRRVGQPRPAVSLPTTRCTPRSTPDVANGRRTRATRRHRRPRCSRWWTPRNRRCGCSSARYRCSWPRPITKAGCAIGSSGSRWPSRRRGKAATRSGAGTRARVRDRPAPLRSVRAARRRSPASYGRARCAEPPGCSADVRPADGRRPRAGDPRTR